MTVEKPMGRGATLKSMSSDDESGAQSPTVEKLGGLGNWYSGKPVESARVTSVFDVASLALYGAQALPVRVKILLDRLFSALPNEDVIHVLEEFGWSYEDYTRGYILQDTEGNMLERWSICSREDEMMIIQQFLRFSETWEIAQRILLAEPTNQKQDADIKKLIERSSKMMNPFMRQADPAALFRQQQQLLQQQHKMSSMFLFPRPGLTFPPTDLPMPNFNSPSHSTSPVSVSPLNRLQNMQPFDFRKEKHSPEPPHSMAPVHPVSSSLHPKTSVHSPGMSSSDIAVSGPSMPLGMPTTPLSVGGSDISTNEGTSEDENSGALNLSRSANPSLGVTPTSISNDETVKHHLRKSQNPMKRRWNPINLGTSLINPATGKKRVQCNVCLKTFCDKGALKIHFSAVHLKEMHKCTVEGCNMMFSSRRSRNRHSANPNPKLHTPHLRRKISPHDGRTSHSQILLPGMPSFPPPPGALSPSPSMTSSNYHPLTGLGFFPQPLDLEKQSLDLSMHRERMDHNNHDVDARMPQATHSMSTTGSSSGLDYSDMKRQRLSDASDLEGDDDLDDNINISDSEDDDNNGYSNDAHSIKEETTGSPKGVRKRKMQNPVKYNIASQDDEEDEDEILNVSSEDMSNDVGFLDNHDNKEVRSPEIKSFVPSMLSSEKLKRDSQEKDVQLTPRNEKNVKEEENESGIQEDESKSVKDSETTAENADTPNALKQLEHLSQGNFGEFMARGMLSRPPFIPTTLPLNLGFMGGFGSQMNMDKLGKLDDSSDKVARSVSPSSDGGDSNITSLAYREAASLLGSLDIPVDRENPRRCTACGKIFQNHFGVKTHYQNVHLKLMHKCTVEGCNAAFPSKRSRDRHSANLNLHRKLLSTSSDKSAFFNLERNHFSAFGANPAFQNEFFARLYGDPSALPLGFDPAALSMKPPTSLAEQMLTNGDRILPPFPSHSLPLMFPPSMPCHDLSMHSKTPPRTDPPSPKITNSGGSPSSTSSAHRAPSAPPPTNHNSSRSSYVYSIEDDVPSPNSEGNMPCKFCHKTFPEGAGLKEHYESLHLPEMFACNVDGCRMIFSSRKRRNAHSQNEAAHTHLIDKL